MQQLLKRRYRERLFTEQEFKAASRIEKIYMHLLEPKRWHLSQDAEVYLERLRQAWAIMMDNAVQRARIRLISDIMSIDMKNEKQIVRIMDDATLLFGDMLKSNRTLDKAILREKLLVLAEKATEAGDHAAAAKAFATIVKMEGFDKEDAAFGKGDVALAPLTFTSDPAAIATGNDDIEDAEVVEDNLLESEADQIPAGPATD